MPIISLSYELFLAASFIAGQYELFLLSNSTSYLWKRHLLLCNLSFKQHLNIVNGGVGLLPRVRWVGLGWVGTYAEEC